jgi:hypothetical protein
MIEVDRLAPQTVDHLVSAGIGSLAPTAACTETHKASVADPHAYRGSDRDVTLSAALRTCGFRVPAASSSLKYLIQKDWDGLVFLVRFTTDKAGYGDFLKSVDLAKDDFVTADSSAFDLDGTRLGWRLEGHPILSHLRLDRRHHRLRVPDGLHRVHHGLNHCRLDRRQRPG